MSYQKGCGHDRVCMLLIDDVRKIFILERVWLARASAVHVCRLHYASVKLHANAHMRIAKNTRDTVSNRV